MESSLHDYHKALRFRTSPYQIYIQNNHKKSVLRSYETNVFLIWTVPFALTVLELLALKKINNGLADKYALFKFASYALATVYSTQYVREAVRQLDYINRLYPRPPQIQVSAVQNAELYKLHAQK
jgi:hypothetical protein